jgi:hypothetical protein
MTLVLAGGGPAALAWELGVPRGLADADAGLTRKVIGADTVIGTSAGRAGRVHGVRDRTARRRQDCQPRKRG